VANFNECQTFWFSVMRFIVFQKRIYLVIPTNKVWTQQIETDVRHFKTSKHLKITTLNNDVLLKQRCIIVSQSGWDICYWNYMTREVFRITLCSNNHVFKTISMLSAINVYVSEVIMPNASLNSRPILADFYWFQALKRNLETF
jgi:hypothetical protein